MLTGIITYRTGYFYAICWRVTGQWEIHDGLAKSMYNFKIQNNTVPEAVIYIKLKMKLIAINYNPKVSFITVKNYFFFVKIMFLMI